MVIYKCKAIKGQYGSPFFKKNGQCSKNERRCRSGAKTHFKKISALQPELF